MKKLMACLCAAALSLASAALAGECCSRCGCTETVRKVCRAVPETKKVKVTVWDCTCEEICIPGRTQTHDCQPTCGQVRTVRKLVKKEVTKEVPSYKWVVENVCGGCCERHGLLHSSKIQPTPAAVAATEQPAKK